MDPSISRPLPKWIMSMLSWKANGVRIDCTTEKIRIPGNYHLVINVFPGRKETFFTKLEIPHCEIANADWDLLWRNGAAGWEYLPDGPFSKESMPVKILVPSKRIDSEPLVFHFIIKPIDWTRYIEVSLSYGGWFNTATSKHYLL